MSVWVTEVQHVLVPAIRGHVALHKPATLRRAAPVRAPDERKGVRHRLLQTQQRKGVRHSGLLAFLPNARGEGDGGLSILDFGF